MLCVAAGTTEKKDNVKGRVDSSRMTEIRSGDARKNRTPATVKPLAFRFSSSSPRRYSIERLYRVASHTGYPPLVYAGRIFVIRYGYLVDNVGYLRLGSPRLVLKRRYQGPLPSI